MPKILSQTSQHIERIVDALREGQIVGLPTETVYGLAADASNASAVEKIFKAKGRPADHPLIVHVAAPRSQSKLRASEDDWIDILSVWAREVPPPALKLVMQFWPGPLTIILPRAKGVLDIVTGGQETVGIRCPDHPAAQSVLQSFAGGLAIPSANRFGRISPTSAKHVFDEFSEDESLLILDGGACQVGIESTIVDLTHWETVGPVILRPGVITAEQIENCTQMKLGEKPGQSIRFSGGLSAHYAPHTSLLLVDEQTNPKQLERINGRVAWVAWVSPEQLGINRSKLDIHFYDFSKEPLEAAKTIYEMLRLLDAQHFDFLVFPLLPQSMTWAGVRDRLSRASIGSGQD